MRQKLFTLSRSQREDLWRRFKQTDDRRIAERLHAILLLDSGQNADAVGSILHIHPKTLKRYEDGPNAIVTVLHRGVPKMGKLLLQWFLLCVFISFTVAYIARHTLHPGEAGRIVMQITGAVAFAGYAMGYLQDSIWKGVPWGNSLRGIADAVVYSLATGLVFRLLWPAA